MDDDFGQMPIEHASLGQTAFAVVQTACDTHEMASAIARALVEEELAACVQILPVESIYRWKGVVETAKEFLLQAKIRREAFREVEARIVALHSYELPEILLLPIEGSAAYLQWIAASTK